MSTTLMTSVGPLIPPRWLRNHTTSRNELLKRVRMFSASIQQFLLLPQTECLNQLATNMLLRLLNISSRCSYLLCRRSPPHLWTWLYCTVFLTHGFHWGRLCKCNRYTNISIYFLCLRKNAVPLLLFSC